MITILVILFLVLFILQTVHERREYSRFTRNFNKRLQRKSKSQNASLKNRAAAVHKV